MRLAARFSILALPVFLFAAACSGSDPLPTATPTATPSATVTPTATPVPAPTSVPTPTLTPAPPATPTPSPTARPASAGLFDYSRAIRLLEIQEFTQAIAAFGLVLRRLPDFAEAYRGRGIAYYKEDLFDLALEDFDKAIELKPGFAAAFRNRGVLYLNSGELEKAAADLETAVALFEEINDFRSASESRVLLRQARP